MRKNLPVTILLFISFAVILANYRFGTWLTGWDNLHPEFNFLLNIQRSIFAVWQEYQGLGLLGGMGHASDLLRQILLFVLSFVFDISFLRYIYAFLMLFAGPLGVYKLLKFLLPNSTSDNKKEWMAGLGGLFYLLNLATVQVFYVPFEAFVTHYGFLPWLFYSAVLYYKSPRKRHLFFLLLINLLSLTQGYVPTIFVVYLISLFIFFIPEVAKNKLSAVKKVSKIFLLIFAVNAFWLLPFLYFTKTSSAVVGAAHENFMATEDIFLRNKEFGTIADVSLLKGFWFKFVDMDIHRDFNYMALPWRDHLSSPYIMGIGYLLFTVVLLGIYRQIRKRAVFSAGFILLFIFSLAMLANDTIPFNFIFTFFQDKLPLFGQVFRVPFTKFSILTAFIYSVFFSFGIEALISRFQKFTRKAHIYITVFSSLLIIIFTFPVFRGYLFYDFVKLKIPQEYFDMIKFFNSQDQNTRIANFPQFTYWGWNHYLWGNRGSGFIWYGIPQPMLDRAFDGYSRYDENYYWEISNALYSSNTYLFDSVLRKYQVGWIVIDRNIVTSSYAKTLFTDKLEEIIANLNNIKLAQVFGKIKVYKVNLVDNTQNFISLADNLPFVGPNYKWNNYDAAFSGYGNYITDSEVSLPDIYYPFRSLFTGRQQNELEFGITGDDEYFSFKTKIPKDLVGYKLEIPALYDKEVTELAQNDLSRETTKIPQVYVDGEYVPYASSSANAIDLPYIKEGNLEIRVPKINGYYGTDIEPTVLNLEPRSCDQFNSDVYKHGIIDVEGVRLLQLTSINSSNCLDFDLPLLSQDLSYLVTVQNRNLEGKSLLFSVINKNSQRADIETYLPKNKKQITNNKEIDTSYFIIPPMEQYGLGYTLHFDNISIGREKTINDLGKITLNPIPYRFLTGLKVIKSVNQLPISSYQLPTNVDHPNPSLYQITLRQDSGQADNNMTLVLSQSFDDGWKAYSINNYQSTIINYLFPFWTGQEIRDHVLVNNWGNGWRLSENKEQRTNNKNEIIIIVYLPQYLEYIGFILLGGAVLIVVFSPHFSYTKSIT